MTKDEIRKRLRSDPFVPLEVALENGDRYVVSHPETVIVGDGEIILYTPKKEVVWLTTRKITALKRMPKRKQA